MRTSYSRLKLCVEKLLESEQMECRRAGLVQTTLLVPLASMASMATTTSVAPMASTATMVPKAVTALLAPKLNIGILQPRLQLSSHTKRNPEVSDGWTELVECELKVPAKLMENELVDCFTKLVKNEQMDYLTKLLAKLMLE